MKNILLIDVDSKIPNLALMQVSAYHKSKGNDVGFNINNPDLVYISCIFKKNGSQARGIATEFIDTPIKIGGSGVSLKGRLPKEMQKIKPDYKLYPDMGYSMGFTTRGCIRKCDFCIVPQKEGKIHKWQPISEFHDDRFKTVMLLDNNILAKKKWFFENTDFILDHNLEVNITQGLDVKLLDHEIAERLHALKFKSHTISFAWDNLEDIKEVKAGIDLLKSVGINTRQDVQFYVLVGYNTTPDQDKFRCRKLKEWDTAPFVMQFTKNTWTKKLARWANRKHILWSIDIDDYNRKKR